MTAWEQFGRKIIGQLFDGYMEIDCMDVQEWAAELGLIEETAYDPDVHGDGPMDFDVRPGDTIYQYAQQGRQI